MSLANVMADHHAVAIMVDISRTHQNSRSRDLFDDVIDTSFWGEKNLEKKFEIIKKNIFTIERDCIENNRFKDDIWKRILKNHNTILNPNNMGKFVYHYAGEELWK